MKLLIVYETVEGQTRKITDFVEQRIRAAGHHVDLFSTRDSSGTVSFDGIDRVILAAPVHERRHPEGFEVFVSTHRDDLASRKTLLISVSLMVAFPEGLEDAQDYLTEMEMRTEFQPDSEILAAGAVRPGSYGYFESQVIRNVILAGRDISLLEGVREFTDWDVLGVQIDEFIQAAP